MILSNDFIGKCKSRFFDGFLRKISLDIKIDVFAILKEKNIQKNIISEIHHQCYISFIYFLKLTPNLILLDQNWDLLKRMASILTPTSSQSHPKRIGSIQNTNHRQNCTKLMQLEKIMIIVNVAFMFSFFNFPFQLKV